MPYFSELERQFAGCKPSEFIGLGNGTFLVDQDECYPSILKIIQYCNQTRDGRDGPRLSLMIAELSEVAVTLSPQHEKVQSWLNQKGYCVRMTKSANK